MDSSWFAIANFSQYVYVKTEPEKRKEIMAPGEPLRGVGVFGRFGYSPEKTTAITQHLSLATFMHGLLDVRPDDYFGVGTYYNELSGDLKDGLYRFSNGDISVGDEYGVEVFYDIAVTPAVSLNISYQHVWNPFQATLAGGEDNADILTVRNNTTW